MNSKKKINIIIGLVVVCILVIFGIFNLTKSIQVAIKRNKKIELRKQKYEADEFYIENTIGEVLNRGVDYDRLPLSDNFIKKYKGKDIIQYEEGQECFFQSDMCYYNKDKNICTIRVSHPILPNSDFGKEEEVRVKYMIDEFYELDDIEILNRRVRYEGGGEYIYYDMFDNTDNFLRLLLNTYAINDCEHSILEVSEIFKNKYPNYMSKSILNDTFKRAYVDETNIKYEFNVKLLDFDRTRYYKATMIPNKEHEEQLDDVIFEFIREEEPMDSKELRSILIDYGNPKIEGWPFDEYK